MPSRTSDEPAVALGHADTATPEPEAHGAHGAHAAHAAPEPPDALADTETPELGGAETPELGGAETPALFGAETHDMTKASGPGYGGGGDGSPTARLGARPEADRLARAVARTRIGNRLFAKQEQVHLGRYHLLEMVGSGGMGVVWGAWDPELERRVAIKLVKATMQAARDRIQIEGQALARLSHPNVVTVHDVGIVDEQIYIVMEWVRGENLRAYCRKPRTLREIVAIYRAAGEGLAAAHAVGLIHRDFKPDNAIRGDDGRVRVLDFGLARSDVRAADDGGAESQESSDLTRGAGTPKYMPPEQAGGGALTAAVDQYAFCVSLREALVGRNADGKDADVPGWLEAIALRGTAREPAARFPSMTELLRALARDPATIWRRRWIAGAALAATAAAFVVGGLVSGNTVEPCSGARQDIARSWNLATRGRMIGHLETLGAYGAGEASRLDGELASYAQRWTASHRAACLASERGELTPQIYERNLGCLIRARVSLETVLDLLARVPAERLPPAAVAARSLPDAERCLTRTQAEAVDPPAAEVAAHAAALDGEIARLRVLARAADPTAAQLAASAVDRARQLGYAPVLARGYLVQGLDMVARGDMLQALPVLDHAATTALDAGDELVFIEAYARQVFGIATTPKQQLPAAAAAQLGAIPYVEHIAHRLGTAATFERALLFNNIGVSRMSAGDPAGARAWFTRALEEPRTRDGDVELVSVLSNLALVADDPATRDGLLARGRDTLAQLLGANHILALEAGFQASMFVARPDLAAAQLRDVCDGVQKFHAREAPVLLSRCAYELGWLAEERGDAAETRAAMQRVGDDRKPIARAYLTAQSGDLDEAFQQARRAADGLQGEWWTRFYAADGLLLAATCAEHLHHTGAAVTSARAALAIYEQLTMIQRATYHGRRVARTRALLARLLASTDAAEAGALAAAAATWYRTAGGYDARLAELTALAPGR